MTYVVDLGCTGVEVVYAKCMFMSAVIYMAPVSFDRHCGPQILNVQTVQCANAPRHVAQR